MKRRKIIRNIALLLLLTFAVSAGGCNDEPSELAVTGGLDDVVVWSAPATEKVLQEVFPHTQDRYKTFKGDASVSVVAAKGEYEGSQIIISTKDIPVKYDLQINELTNSNGENFPVENIDVFHEKYIEITANYEQNGNPLGKYPDALVPVKNIKEAGENVIEKENNQGLYFRFNIPLSQPSGIYQGNAILTIGEDKLEIPVKLAVRDAVVSEESHARTIFQIGKYGFGEQDSTAEMAWKYDEALFEYRLNPGDIMEQVTHSDERIKIYVDKSYEFMQNPHCNTIVIPYTTEIVDGQLCFDRSIMKKYILAFAQKSFENNYNMFDKLILRFGIIDEPDVNGLEQRTEVLVRACEKTLKEMSDKILSYEGIDPEIKEEVANGILNLKNVVTATTYSKEYADIGIDTWCPQFTDYHTPEGRDNYENQEEKWWYGCILPRAPHPTYHIDDTLLSARSVGWMQGEYDIVGNLYWETTVYGRYLGNPDYKYIGIENYYENASRYPQVNGDGFLFYPGKRYGIDGPVGSMRLEAIRDGQEDYELIYALKNKYKAISENDSAGSMIRSIAKNIYSGTSVNTTSEKFKASRETLMAYCELLEKFNVLLLNFDSDDYDNSYYEFIAPSDVTLKENGKIIESTGIFTAKNGVKYKKYGVNTKLENDYNELKIDFEKGDDKYTFTQYLGGSTRVIKCDTYTYEDFAKKNITPELKIVEGADVDNLLTGKVAEVVVPEASEGKLQSFIFKGDPVNKIDKNVSKIRLHIWYSGEKAIKFQIDTKYSKQQVLYNCEDSKLKPGMNTIDINISDRDQDKLGNIEYFVIYLNSKESSVKETLYFVDIVVFNK